MERDKYKLNEEQKELFEQYKDTVDYTIYKQFYSLSRKANILELRNVGYLGLIYAIKTYDESKGANMLTWSINNIKFALNRYIKAQSVKKNKPLSCLSMDMMEQMERTGEPCGEKSVTLFWDYFGQYEDELNKWQTVDLLNEIAKEKLSAREYAVYEKLYIDGKTAVQTSKELGISRTRVYQVERKIIIKLKLLCEERGLK